MSRFEINSDKSTEPKPIKNYEDFIGITASELDINNFWQNSTDKFKDSGERQKFETGAQRDTSSGKGRFDLMPPIASFFISLIYETGCLKYGDRNWEKGIPIARYLDSAQRHIGKYQAGLRDEPHLSMAAWNLSCALWTAAMVELKLRPQSLFNLPNHVSNQELSPLSEFELKGLENFIGRSINNAEQVQNI